MIVYLLFYDTDFGFREEWNTFYTPVEVFSSQEKRNERISELENTVDSDEKSVKYLFYELEVEIDKK